MILSFFLISNIPEACFYLYFCKVGEEKKHTNALISEKSPYLLQHAHNPVDWHPWNQQTLRKAKEQDKLILVSVGYSACHWCHVMEHESFEDEEVAAIMNKHFICIKVDREERPDIDHVYMSAVQIMTGHGGWPLNCFALPNGRPIFGGTYFPRGQWMNILNNLANLWEADKEKAEKYAFELTQGLHHMERVEVSEDPIDFSMTLLRQSVKKWKEKMDTEKGGTSRAPKFPMPNNWLYLLRYAHFTNDNEIKRQVHLTLGCMANGGIYDHVGGGFSRYSTDMDWKVPHFEKMLYDNAQLVSLFSEAYAESRIDLYREVVYETIDFVERELSAGEGGFYSALDADSEGEEGKYYVWEKEELNKIIGENDFPLFSGVFSVNENGYWEDDKFILLNSTPLLEIAVKNSLLMPELKQKISGWKKILLENREKRMRPALDDKILASWNALMAKGLCDAYRVFGEERFLERAIRCAEFLSEKFMRPQGGLFHAFKNGEAYINGFLEDYAFTVEAFIALFCATGNEAWFERAESLTSYAFEKFHDPHSGMFYFTSSEDAQLVVRKTEITDNVIPASASQMARNLYALYRLTGNSQYRATAAKMLNNIRHEIAPYPSGYSNWSLLMLEMLERGPEVSIVGKNVDEKNKAFRQHYLPTTIFVSSRKPSSLPPFKNKWVDGKTLIYVCRDNTCKLPVEHVDAALAQFS